MTVAEKRRQSPHTSMFLRMLMRAAVLRRGRAISALLAMIIAAAVTTTMLNLYVDVQAKLRKEFRNYGANVVVVGKDGASLPADALDKVHGVIGTRDQVVPFAYVVARSNDGQSVVVAGTSFDEVRRLNSWWSVSTWPHRPDDALVGVRAASALGGATAPINLTFHDRKLTLNSAGTVRTGADEDSRIYLPLATFEEWTNVAPSTLEIAVSGTPEEVSAAATKLAQVLPQAEVKPVRQVMEGEARVLGKTKSTLLYAAVLIILTAGLCVLSTLTGWVFDRRRDFAIMKALGASERLINGFFAAEAAALGAVGALLGFLIGIGAAAWIGRVNFHAPVVPRFSVLPFILAGSIAVALLSAVLPISLLRRVQPAMILRGE